MNQIINHQWTLASRPSGVPSVDNFKLTQSSVAPLKSGEILIKTLFLSVDPYIRARMRNVKSYVPPYEIGQVIEAGAVGEVVESQDPAFKKHDFVSGKWGWQQWAAAPASSVQKVRLSAEKLSLALGALGMTGMTAYFALLDVGRPQPGETVLVSGAAGAVGSLVGQIAKIKGCRAVGVAGSDEKCRMLIEELGFDAAINYKTTKNIRKALREACPTGVDIYFDNVGGPISDAAVTQINMKARVVVCGQISILNRERTEEGPRNWLYFLVYRARLEGFLVMDYVDRYPEGIAQMKQWIDEGRITVKETFVEGFENTPHALLGLLNGENLGKQVVRVAAPA